jgi:hypothetical protein
MVNQVAKKEIIEEHVVQETIEEVEVVEEQEDESVIEEVEVVENEFVTEEEHADEPMEEPTEVEEEEEEEEEPTEVEEEEEAGVYEIEVNGVRYYTTNEQDGIVYALVEDDDVGDEVGSFVKGKLVLNK